MHYFIIPTILLLSALQTTNAEEAVLHLKNKDRLSGQVWIMDAQFVLLETLYGSYRIERKFIKKVTFQLNESPKLQVTLPDGRYHTGELLSITAAVVRIKTAAAEYNFQWEDIQDLIFLDR